MHVITHSRIIEAAKRWPQAKTALDGWYRLMKANEPSDFASMKQLFPAVDKVGKFHVFDIGGNKIRLIAVVMYQAKRVYIRQVLSHDEYDKGHWKEG
jgi:mRNA interferase HigB